MKNVLASILAFALVSVSFASVAAVNVNESKDAQEISWEFDSVSELTVSESWSE